MTEHSTALPSSGELACSLQRRLHKRCPLVGAGPSSSRLIPVGLAWGLVLWGSALNFCVLSLKKKNPSLKSPKWLEAGCGGTAKGCEISFGGDESILKLNHNAGFTAHWIY